MTDKDTAQETNTKNLNEASVSEEKDEAQDRSIEGNYEGDQNKVERDLERARQKGVDFKEFEETRKALAKANKEAQKRREQLRQWEELGVNPEQVRELLKQQREAEIKKAEEEGRYQELIDKIREEANQERKLYQERLKQMEEKLQKQLYEKDLQSALIAEDGIPDLLEAKLKKHTKMVETEEGYKTVVLDENGQETDLSVRDLLKQWKQDEILSHGFRAPRVSGNGTSSNSSGKASSSVAPKKRRSEMTLQEKNEYRAKYGLEAYKKLPI